MDYSDITIAQNCINYQKCHGEYLFAMADQNQEKLDNSHTSKRT